MSRKVTLGDLAGELDGYRAWAPTGLGAHIDEEVAAGATCAHCGYVGCLFHGYRGYGEYRAFAVCPACRHAMEF